MPQPAKFQSRWLLSSVILATGLLSGSCQSNPEEASSVDIYGGEVVSVSRHPAAKLIERATVRTTTIGPLRNCTGVLIHPSVVLFAAHCFVDGISVRVSFPLAGEVRRVAGRDVVIHKSFDPKRKSFGDIAILKLSKPAPKPYEPVALASASTELKGVSMRGRKVKSRGQAVIIAGFGRLDSTTKNAGDKLYMAEMELYLLKKRKGMQYFAGKGVGACAGDSGGPIVVYQNRALTLIGVKHRASCDATQNKRSLPVFGKFRPFSLYGTSAVVHSRWIRSNLPATIRSGLQERNVRFESATEVRNDEDTKLLMRNFSR